MSFKAHKSKLQAEAASWLARLHSSEKTNGTDAAFRSWLNESDEHKSAFEQATEVWDLIPSALGACRIEAPARNRHWRPLALAASLAMVVSASSIWWVARDPVYETEVGEQQLVMLDDHTRVALNTNSELKVRYSTAERLVLLDHGEALFDVTKQLSRPFVVVAGAQRIQALGTKFVVRQESNETRVTLLEGRVIVMGPSAPRQSPLAVLKPGQRVIITPAAGASLDRPSLDSATAWRRGEVVFENASLIEAAAEFNRYSEAHIIVSDPALASKRISGVFATDDVGEVAKAIAALHGLEVQRDGKDFKLKSM